MDQSFVEYKKKWVNTIYAERRAKILLFHTADLIVDASVQIKDSLKDVQKGAVLIPKERDTYGIGPPTKDVFKCLLPIGIKYSSDHWNIFNRAQDTHC